MSFSEATSNYRSAWKLILATLALVLLTVGIPADNAVGSDRSGSVVRTWVSGLGSDANPCSRTAPCLTWAGAYSKTLTPGGEIDALDSSGYGSVTITGGITLNGGTGNTAGIVVGGVKGIVVAAGPNDVVILRNLDLNGLYPNTNSGIYGIEFLSGKALYIENSTIENFGSDAVHIAPTAGGFVTLKNDIMRNDGKNAVLAKAGTAALQVLVEGCTIQGNGNGAGIVSVGSTTGVVIEDNVITSNTYGLLSLSAGGIVSFGGNLVDLNTNNGAPTVTKQRI
jgi:hypothetical protein